MHSTTDLIAYAIHTMTREELAELDDDLLTEAGGMLARAWATEAGHNTDTDRALWRFHTERMRRKNVRIIARRGSASLGEYAEAYHIAESDLRDALDSAPEDIRASELGAPGEPDTSGAPRYKVGLLETLADFAAEAREARLAAYRAELEARAAERLAAKRLTSAVTA